jgi:hypothetical protein
VHAFPKALLSFLTGARQGRLFPATGRGAPASRAAARAVARFLIVRRRVRRLASAMLAAAALGCGSSNLQSPDGGGGGTGGASACQQIAALDRTCTTDADCVAVLHTTSCCGSASWIGLHASETQRFRTLESACDATYPACGCASGEPTTDDGSTIAFGASTAAGVSCTGGVCKTFAAACGHACDTGRSCLTCGSTSVCSLRCTADTSCTEAAYPKCMFGFGGGLCADAAQSCTGF